MSRIIFVFGYSADNSRSYINEQKRWYKAYDMPEFKILSEPQQLAGYRNIEIISLVPPALVPDWLGDAALVRDCTLSFVGRLEVKATYLGPADNLLLLCDL